MKLERVSTDRQTGTDTSDRFRPTVQANAVRNDVDESGPLLAHLTKLATAKRRTKLPVKNLSVHIR